MFPMGGRIRSADSWSSVSTRARAFRADRRNRQQTVVHADRELRRHPVLIHFLIELVAQRHRGGITGRRYRRLGFERQRLPQILLRQLRVVRPAAARDREVNRTRVFGRQRSAQISACASERAARRDRRSDLFVLKLRLTAYRVADHEAHAIERLGVDLIWRIGERHAASENCELATTKLASMATSTGAVPSKR